MCFLEWKSKTARTNLTFSSGSYQKEILMVVKESNAFKSQIKLPFTFLERELPHYKEDNHKSEV